jgi:hypothetical protein
VNAAALALVALLLGIHQLGGGLDLLSLLMLVPLLVSLIPALDSLQGQGQVRVWDRWRMRFCWLPRRQQPWAYWINVAVSRPATLFFAYALVMMPKR